MDTFRLRPKSAYVKTLCAKRAEFPINREKVRSTQKNEKFRSVGRKLSRTHSNAKPLKCVLCMTYDENLFFLITNLLTIAAIALNRLESNAAVGNVVHNEVILLLDVSNDGELRIGAHR